MFAIHMDFINIFLFKLSLLMFLNVYFVNSEMYTSVEDLKILLTPQRRFIESLDDYLKKEEKRFNYINRYVNWILKQSEITSLKYLNNPINAYTFLKRLTFDTDFIEKKIITRTEDNRNAKKYIGKILEMRPGDPRYRHHMASIDYYEEQILKEIEMRKYPAKFARFKPKFLRDPEMTPQTKTAINFEAVCREEKKISRDVAKRLTCKYMTGPHPYLRLAPIKMEQLYIQPDLYKYYNVISDSEIEFLKNQARPNLRRSLVSLNAKTTSPSLHRISKVTWLDRSEVVAKIDRRITHITGLSMDSAEDLQVVTYGSAGYYEPHYDVSRNKSNIKIENSRLATFMFYLTDVPLGGAVAFIRLGLTVAPTKGSALFWYNLHPSGEPDLTMLHGACPIIHGIKWVAIKFIQEKGNELTRPCTLEYQPEDILNTIKRRVKKKPPKIVAKLKTENYWSFVK